jgi:RNA polymerase sigma-70 factor (ECF subfamily)
MVVHTASGRGLALTSEDIDARTLARARHGDGVAFTALVRHYDDGLRALAYRLLGDRARMDDALQEAYLNAYRALPGFRGDASLRTWLYRIVYNACLDELRRSRSVVAIDSVRTLPARTADPAESLSVRESLAAALDGLPPEDRAAVLFVDGAGFDYRGAAEVLGIPEGTVGSRLNRARADLRNALADRRKGVWNG